VPDFFDLGERRLSIVIHRGEGGLGQTLRHANAQAARCKLDQCQPFGGFKAIQPAFDMFARLLPRRTLQGLHYVGEAQKAAFSAGPDQGDGLGEVADVIVRQTEESRVRAFLDDAPQAGCGGIA